MKKVTFDDKQIRFFVPFVLADGYCVETRAFEAMVRNRNVVHSSRFSSTVGGYFDDPHSLISTATHFDGVSPYVTVNPVKHDLMARVANRLKHLGRGEGTKDEDIACVRYIPLDLDPIRPDKISSTDEELGLAVELRDRILAENPEIAASSIWGKSGNGCWIWVRVGNLPNTPETYERVKRFIGHFAERYGDKGKPNGTKVIIDRKTCNAARVMAFPGTLKCKGEDDRRRPWRLATIDSMDRTAETLAPLDLDRWEQANPQASETPGRSASQSTALSFASGAKNNTEDRTYRVQRAASWLAKKPGAVAGNEGHDDTYAAATGLIHGFGLTIPEATPLMEAWNQTCIPEWEPHDLARKLDQAATKPHDKPFGYLYDSPNPTNGNGVNGNGHGHAHHTPGEGREFVMSLMGVSSNATAEVQQDSSNCLPGQEANPHRLAKLFLTDRHYHSEGSTLRFWRDEFFAWNGRAYSPVPNKEIRAAVATVVASEFERLWVSSLMKFRLKQAAQKMAVNSAQTSGQPSGANGGDKEPKLLPVTSSLVTDVTQALSGLVLVPVADFPAQPAWLDETNDWSPTDILPTTTALVHLRSLSAGQPCKREPTPRFFSTWSCDYGFSDSAAEPAEWLKFLHTLWPADPMAVEMLQEWFGYCLTLDTRQQKILMLIGPKRAGKGTIANVLSALLGPENVAGPTLTGIANSFGLAPLVGKPLAIIDDARLSGRADQAVITERLLTISGEGTITVERKYLDAWTGKLPTRIVLLSNELPKLTDSSGALPGRLLILRLTNSFFGREDKELFDRLVIELPGILLWAIEGWKRLQERGSFIEPESAKSLKSAMSESSSPIAEFVAEQCRVEENARIARSDLFNAWKSWSQSLGREHVGDESSFGRKLHSVVSELGDTRPRINGSLVRCYTGIRLKTELERAQEESSESDELSDLIQVNAPVF